MPLQFLSYFFFMYKGLYWAGSREGSASAGDVLLLLCKVPTYLHLSLLNARQRNYAWHKPRWRLHILQPYLVASSRNLYR